MAGRGRGGDNGAVPDAPVDHARARWIDWLMTPPFLVAFVGTLLLFDPLQRVARLFGQRPQEYVAGWLQIALVFVFRIAGTRLVMERDPAVAPGTPYLILANHQSMFDIPIFGAAFFRNFPKYVSKRELARWIPSISYNLRRGGNAIIDRSDREAATRAIRALGAQVRERGVSAVIYPEGTRSRDGRLGPFKPAGALALFEEAPETAIVPVAIDGSWRLLRFNLFPIPFGTRVRMHIGAPIPRSPEEDRLWLLHEARARIEQTLEDWRSESP